MGSSLKKVTTISQRSIETLTMIGNRPFWAFVGAGISRASPANAPLWSEIKSDTIGFVCGLLAEYNKRWKTELDFYSLLNQLVQDAKLLEIISEIACRTLGKEAVCKQLSLILNGGSPNISHMSLAKLAKDGVLQGIVTTNFDVYIERALESMKVPYQLLMWPEVKHKDTFYKKYKLSLIKIHGSIDKMTSLIFTLRDSNKPLPSQMATLLRKALTDNNVFICGYSGNDSDVFPILHDVLATNSTKGFDTWILNKSMKQGRITEPLRDQRVKTCAIQDDCGRFLASISSVEWQDISKPESSKIDGNLFRVKDDFLACLFVADLLLCLGQYDLSRKLFWFNYDLGWDRDDPRKKAIASEGLSLCYQITSDIQEVLSRHELAKALWTKVEDEDITETDHYWMWKGQMAEAYLLSRFPEHTALAESIFNSVIGLLNTELQNWSDWRIIPAIEAFLGKARISKNRGNLMESKMLLEKGINLSESEGIVHVRAILLYELSNLLDSIGQAKEAEAKRNEAKLLLANSGLNESAILKDKDYGSFPPNLRLPTWIV